MAQKAPHAARIAARFPKPPAPAADTAAAPEEFSIIPKEKLMALYSALLRDASVPSARVRPGGSRAPGEWKAVEAAGPGVCLDLNPDDLVILGAESERLRTAAGLDKAAGSIGSPDERLPELIGKALAYKTQKSGRVCVAFWREGNLQPWLDAMEIARAHALPVVFVCPPLNEKAIRQLASFAAAPGTELPRITVDGNDPVAVYRVAHESIDRARRRRGATLIECSTFRTPGARTETPLANMERYVRGKGMFTLKMRREMMAQTGGKN